MPLKIRVAGRTDRGMRRRRNEDSFLIVDLRTGKAWRDPELRSHTVPSQGLLMMVADGMGGAAGGEVASSLALEHIHRWFLEHHSGDDLSDDGAEALLTEATVAANAALHTHAADHPRLHGMGTTLTGAWVRGHGAHIVQVGDSRAYLLQGERIRQLTEDQSLREHLIRAVGLSEEEASRHAGSHVILQALGVQPTIQPVTSTLQLESDDVLLLCSDGLTAALSDDAILEAAGALDELERATEALVAAANARGGPDNITVVLMRVTATDPAKPEGPDASPDATQGAPSEPDATLPVAPAPDAEAGRGAPAADRRSNPA